MTRDEKLDPEGEKVAQEEFVIVAGYAGRFGEANMKGETIDPSNPVRAPQWMGTELEKDDVGVLVTVAVPQDRMPGAKPSESTMALEARIAELEAQMELPLTAREVEVLRSVLAEQKVKVGETGPLMEAHDLLEKLDAHLHPRLFAEIAGKDSAAGSDDAQEAGDSSE